MNAHFNSHYQLFSSHLIHNLRACRENVKEDLPPVIYELEKMRNSRWRRKERVLLTMVDSQFTTSFSATLTLKESNGHYAKYTGSLVNETGYHVRYRMIVRTDVDESMQKRGIIAAVHLKTSTHAKGWLSRAFSVGSRTNEDLDIYDE